MPLLREGYKMTLQQKWRLKRMMLFGAFSCAGGLLPIVPMRVPGICLFEKLLGIPCPGCGIYSSIVSMLHGNWQRAIVHNPMGPFVFVVCIGLAGYFLYVVISKKEIPWAREIYMLRLVSVVTFSLLVIQWVYRLFNH